MIADEGLYQMDFYETSAMRIQSSFKNSQEYDCWLSVPPIHTSYNL